MMSVILNDGTAVFAKPGVRSNAVGHFNKFVRIIGKSTPKYAQTAFFFIKNDSNAQNIH